MFIPCLYIYSSDPTFFKGWEWILITSLGGRGIWNIKKREWKYGAGAGLLKRGRRRVGMALLLFDFFKVYHFYIFFTFRKYFTLCKVVLYIWRKGILFCQHTFLKKNHSKLSKNEPVCICKEGCYDGKGQGEIAWNTLWKLNRKEGSGSKSFKKKGESWVKE